MGAKTWQETVINQDRITSLVNNWNYGTAKIEDKLREHIVQAQAEETWDIAFKAGMKEVAEWLENHLINMDTRTFPDRVLTGADYQRLQAKLKEWEL